MPPKTITVTRAEAGQKLLQFLERRTGGGVPRSGIMRWIRTGQVRVDGGRKKPFFRLDEGMEVRIPPYTPGEKREQPVPKGLEVVHEDDDLLVLAKPAGLPVHGGSGHDDSITARLNAVFRGADFVPALVHRLDRDTSGLLLAGKTYVEVRRLSDLFAAKGAAGASVSTHEEGTDGGEDVASHAVDADSVARGGVSAFGSPCAAADSASEAAGTTAGDIAASASKDLTSSNDFALESTVPAASGAAQDLAADGLDGGATDIAEENGASESGIGKIYLCWVWGEFPEGRLLLEDALEKSADEQGVEKVRVGSGKVALAEAVRVDLYAAGTARCRSLVAVRLITGRTHQIRVQLAERGHPLAGDRKYGVEFSGRGEAGGASTHETTSAPTLMLHAFQIILPERSFQLAPPWTGPWAVGEAALERASQAFC